MSKLWSLQLPFQVHRQVFRRLALGLPIPVLALLFWFSGQALTQHLLSHAYTPEQSLRADAQTQIQVQAAVLAIEIEVKPHVSFTKVFVKTTNSAIKTLELEFLSTDISEVEALIAQELKLDPQTVSQLARYQVESP